MSQEDAHIPAWVEVLGWYGMLAITTAYALNARKILDDGLLYQGLNASGALALLILCRQRKDWPTFTLEGVWLLVSLWAILQT